MRGWRSTSDPGGSREGPALRRVERAELEIQVQAQSLRYFIRGHQVDLPSRIPERRARLANSRGRYIRRLDGRAESVRP